jgi:2-dehydropantoate 2-reductase
VKVAVVGCGAVGSYYGARLWRSGFETHFLLRADYAVVRERGVRIHSVEGDFTAHPVSAQRPEEIGPCDWVLVALKTTANRELPRLIPPLVGPATSVVTLQNGLGNERGLAECVGRERVLGGLCFVCLNRVAPGVVRHTAHGKIDVGEYQRPPAARARELTTMLEAAGVPCLMVENLERARWEKLVWNVPFNGLGVAGIAGHEALFTGCLPDPAVWGPCLATDRLLGEPRWEALVRELMREVILAAQAQGWNIPESFAEYQISRTRCMGAYRASTLIDYERGLPLELESLFEEPLRQAQARGVPVPRLTALCAVLAQLRPASVV